MDYRFPIQYIKSTKEQVDPIPLTKTLKGVSDEALDLIYKMCLMHPEYRFSAEECLRHPYFENLKINDSKNEPSPSYFMEKDFYHKDHDPRVYYREKIK
mmetsp:Transcript_8296/g.7347  ORF Transcript_8296/g.7347 Transcript_8296/m.7347 type:complete len:99 (-) Transcript_8296:448-744(-)